MKKPKIQLILLCFLLLRIQAFGQINIFLEAENATRSHRTKVDNAHRGFKGEGFVDFYNENGSYIEYDLGLPTAGQYTLSMRYANGSTDRTMDIWVNGTLIRNQFNFPSTTQWNNWNTLSFQVNLTKCNTIRFESANPNGGPNLDQISLVNPNISGNFEPVAVNDTIHLTVNQQISIPVLNNDFDPNADHLHIVSIGNIGTPARGEASLIGDGFIRYIPENGFEGNDAFSYTITDGVYQRTGLVIIDIKDIDWSVEFANMVVETRTPANVGGWSYTMGLLLEGMLRVYMRTKDTRYLEFVDDWFQLHISETGEIDSHINSLDNMMPGFTLLHLYPLIERPKYKLAVDKIRANYNTFPKTSEGGFWHRTTDVGQTWLDGLYMSTPFIATYGMMFNDGNWCYPQVITQYKAYINHLKNEASGILLHAYDEDGSAPWAVSPLNRSTQHWARSIGWVMMGLMEVVDIIPENYPEKNALVDMYTSVLTNLVQYQEKNTGLWYQVVDKGNDERNWLEASCTMMYALGMKRAIQNGLLPDSFNKYADLAYSGILSKVSFDENNRAKLTDVCVGTGVSSDILYYLDRTRAINDSHGVGTFMIMNEYFAHNNLPWKKNEATGLQRKAQEKNMATFPNPCEEYLFIDLGGDKVDQTEIVIYSVTNSVQLVKKFDHLNQSSLLKVDVSSLLPGAYVLKVSSSSQSYTTPIIKR